MNSTECESVLVLLSSLKSQVSSALVTIQNCSSSKEIPVQKQDKDPIENSNVKMNTASQVPTPAPEGPASRDDVKAQREAKKAAKAAKKNASKDKDKSEGGAPTQIPDKKQQAAKSTDKVVNNAPTTPKIEKTDSKKPIIESAQPAKSPLKDKNNEKLVLPSPAAGDVKNAVPNEKDKPEVVVSGEEKSKAQMKAERRAIQEAQRAAKAAATKENISKGKPASDSPKVTQNKSAPQGSTSTAGKPTEQNAAANVVKKDLPNRSSLRPKPAKRHMSESKMQTLFDHLPHSGERNGISHANLDPVFVTLGQKYANGVFTSSKERCIELFNTLGNYIKEYRTPPGKDFKYALAQSLIPNFEFLQKSRPFAVAMENAVEHFNNLLRGLQSQTDLNQTEQEIKAMLDEELLRFVDDKINAAQDAIVRQGKDRIKNHDVLLIFGCSELVWSIINAAAEKKSFCLVIVRDVSLSNDSIKDKILQSIEKFIDIRKSKGDTSVSVDYIGITGLSNRIQTVTKVFLDAEGLLTNGKVLARAGTSQIALLASEHNIPVLICCETYKFCDKSPTDSFSLNELKSPSDSQEYDGYLKTPELVYDITPSELVTAVITDVDMLPSTSVPVVLRVQENRSRNV